MRIAGEGMDNAVKGGTLVKLKTVIEIAYMGDRPQRQGLRRKGQAEDDIDD